MLPVVYVHIGGNPAPHLVDTIGHTRRVSPSTPIFVVLSRNTTMAEAVAGKNTAIVYSDALRPTAAHQTYIGSVRRRLGKKRGFWRFTTERFFLLEELMAQHSLTSLLHLESDNVIFFDVEAIAADLRELYRGMATPFLNDELCVPGVVYIGDASVLSDLNAYIAQSVTEEAIARRKWYRPRFFSRVRMGIKLHDMKLLADFRRQDAGDRLKLLPMVPTGYEMADGRAGRQDCRLPFSQGFERLQMIFDGAAFGQYLYGLDPNHHDATGSIGMVDPQGCIRATDFGFDELDIGKRDAQPFLTYRGAKIRLASLHNHSKRKLFTD